MATNVSPSISPDGRHIVFFSSRDLFSIDLYLADATTGRIVRKLVDTALNSHFTSLQFIGSAGSWSPDSRQFVVGGVHAGKAVLAILDVADGDVVREIEVPEVGEILNPTWSPDGKSIAFSATVGGDSDLFIYDLAAGTAKRDHQRSVCRPAAGVVARRRLASRSSPIGSPRTPKLLQAGDYRLALYDVASGPHLADLDVRAGQEHQPAMEPRQPAACSSCPIRTASATSIASTVQSGALAQITNIDSGISGITALSPAISSAIDARTLAVSAYEDGSHHIYLIESPQQLAGTPIVSTVARLQAASLPPAQRESLVARMLNDPTTGLPPLPAEVEPYKSGLSLDAVSQPYISAGVDRFGGMVGGGIAFSFSDMLGNHNLYAQVSADTYGGGAGDIAQEHRRGRRLHEHVEAVELGLRRRAVAVHRRRVCHRPGRRERRACAARSDHHPAADQPRRQRHGGVSVQPDRAHRVRRRLHAHVVRTAGPDDGDLAAHAAACSTIDHVTTPLGDPAEHVVGQHGARHRQLALRRDEPRGRAALALRSRADVRRPAV